MNELETVSGLVKSILEQDVKARNTDNYLYLRVLEHYSCQAGINIQSMTVPLLLQELDQHKFPGFETVRRSRQKVQADYPDLAANAVTRKRRAKKEGAYRDYAKSEV